jgi:hypothetical protein
MDESIKIWMEIRDSASKLHKTGVNSGEILKWSRKKTFNEVQLRLHEILRKSEDEKYEAKEVEDEEIRKPGDIRGNTKVI